MDQTIHDRLLRARFGQVIGFFPGLGSRVFYQNLGRGLLDSRIPEVTEIYRDSAQALGLTGQPERLLLTPENIPAGKLAAQGFIGAAFLAHSLALEVHLRAMAENGQVPVRLVGYTGESFGIITAAVASGALSVVDGIKLGYAFTPLMLTAANGVGPNDPLAADMAAYLPESLSGGPLVSEPYHVIGLRGESAALGEILADIATSYPKSDVEVHKIYSRRQTNIYVRAGIKANFDLFTKGYLSVETTELKAPTTFLAHSERMMGGRQAFDRFITTNGIVFRKPHTQVISNNNSGLLTTAAEVRNGVLAITNEIMASQATVETLESLRPDVVLELGVGNKSVQLLIDNNVDIPVTAYAGLTQKSGLVLRAVQLVNALLGDLENLRVAGGRLTELHYHTCREIFRLSGEDSFCERYFSRTIGRVVADEIPHQTALAASPEFHEFLEIFQNTYNYRDHIDLCGGELALQARFKKRIAGASERLGQAYAELKVIDRFGIVSYRSLIRSERHEVMVFHFGQFGGLNYTNLAGNIRLLLDTQPLARQIYDHIFKSLKIEDDGLLTLVRAAVPTVKQLALGDLIYQYTLFRLLHLHRPAVFMHDYYIAGSDPMGWSVALAASRAATLQDVVRLYSAYLWRGMKTVESQTALDRVLASLSTPDIPVISPWGIPLRAKIDLEATTRVIFR